MKTFSGNASDHQTLKETMVQIQSGLRKNLANDEEAAHFIADAAFYSKPNLANFGPHWILRVPGTLTESEALLHQDVELQVGEDDERYSFYETSSNYADIRQKWVLIYSQEMAKKNEITFVSRLEKQLSKAQKALNHLIKRQFACEADAIAESAKWISAYDLLDYSKLKVRHENRRVGGLKGRPKKGETMQECCFIEAALCENTEAVARERRGMGRFILASNDESLSGQEILKIYKNQSQVERGFRFLKDKSFLVSEVFLKKEERIEALAFIMVLCLTIYSLLEVKLRKGLTRKSLTIPNQLRKPTSQPTLKWAFSFFAMVCEAKILFNGTLLKIDLSRIEQDRLILTILDALGANFKKAYCCGGF
jgi:transposase